MSYNEWPSNEEIDYLIDRWHEGDGCKLTLPEYFEYKTGFSEEEFGRWAADAYYRPPNCYCVCHSPLSSRPWCEHCKGYNSVTKHYTDQQ